MSLPKRILLVIMGLFYIGAGTLHFTNTAFYRPLMPPYLPWHDALIYLSGFAEISLGVGVLVPRTRRLSAWGLIALLIAIFPANIHTAVNDVALGGATEGAGVWNWVRLPFQGLFILWAWWYTTPEAASGLRLESNEGAADAAPTP